MNHRNGLKRLLDHRMMIPLLGLVLMMETGHANAQNAGEEGKVATKDTLSRNPAGAGLPSFPQAPIADDVLIPSAGAVISDDFNKKLGVPLLKNNLSDCHFLENTDWEIKRKRSTPYAVKPLQMIIPVSLFVLGNIGQESDWFQKRNKEIRDELQEHVRNKFTIDDISQYAPMAATYGLNLCGIRGQHGYGDLTILLGTAYALMGVSVNCLKNTTRVMRPDGSTRNSFPSGHTATAFMGAELLRREYKDVSPWIGVTGYAVAAGTGFLRMYNNRHWLTDVVAGAGIGIMSVEAAYWLYPVISKTFFRKRYLRNAFISPYVSEEGKGVACNITF